MTHAEFTKDLWYFSRSAGVLALVLLTLSIALGVLSRSGRSIIGIGRFGVSEMHRTIALIGLGLVVAHVVTLLFDPYAQLHLMDVVLPFRSVYRPLWVGLGTTAFDLVLVVIVVSLMRERVGLRAFRVVHWTVYGIWPLALAHGLGSGTDAGRQWMLYVALGCAAIVVTMTLWRLSTSYAERGTTRIARKVVR